MRERRASNCNSGGGPEDATDDMAVLPVARSPDVDKDDKNEKSSSWRRRCCMRCLNNRLFIWCRSLYQTVALKTLLLWLFMGVVVMLALLEMVARLRFHGIFGGQNDHNGQLGFYHEMDVDMRTMRSAAENPRVKLFPASIADRRELGSWVRERHDRTNGFKYLVGCTPSQQSAMRRHSASERLFTTFKTLNMDWNELETRRPTEFFYKQDPKKAPSVLLFCLSSTSDLPMYLLLDHNRYFQKLRGLGTLLVVWSDDLSVFDQLSPVVLQEKVLKSVDVLLSAYAYLLDQYMAPATYLLNTQDLPLTVWLPHAAGADFAVASINDYPIDKLFLLPAPATEKSAVDPMQRWLQTFQASNGSVMDVHDAQLTVGSEATCAAYLRSYCAGITAEGSLIQYVTTAMFEIAATGALLVVNRDVEPMLNALQLRDREHFVAFDRTDPECTLSWVVDAANRKQIDAIREAGMYAVREQHLLQHRVESLRQFLVLGLVNHSYPIQLNVSAPRCPSIAFSSKSECLALHAQHAHYKCDRWFCGLRSLLGH